MNIHLKLLFPNAPTRKTIIKFTTTPTLQAVLNKLQTKYDLNSFTDNNRALPHIMILVNDVQYELKGNLEQPLRNGDTITLLSLVHGGTCEIRDLPISLVGRRYLKKYK